MNNRSIAWWLRQIGLPQYTKTLERQYYGLEGLLYVTEGDLREAGVDDPEHRETILNQLSRQQQRLNPASAVTPAGPAATPGRVTRKYSLGSSMDLMKPSRRLSGQPLDLFRQSILPRLRRRDRVTLSSSCSQLGPLQETLSPPSPDEDPPHPAHPCISSRKEHRSKRKSVGVYLSQLKVFGGRGGMDTLKKELEEELKLSIEDLRSHAWYHGQLHREGAEALLERDGDFLIRDSRSSPGDYVLTCQWRDEPMHFKIIRVVLRPKKGYSRELYQFEQDQFDNVPALVRFHVGGRRPISEASGAIIFHPVTRTVPLRVIAERQAARTSSSSDTCWLAKEQSQQDRSKRLSFSSGQMDTLHVNSNLLRNKEKSGSHPGNLENLGRRPSLQSAQSDSNLRSGVPQSSPSDESSSAPISPVFRTGSEPMLSPRTPRHTRPSHPGGGDTLRGSDGQLHSRAPPKPLRISAVFPGPTLPPLPPRSQDTDPSCFYDELVPRAPPSSRPRGHADRLRAEEKWQSRARLTETSFSFLEAGGAPDLPGCPPEEADGEGEPHFTRPQVETSSCFRLEQFNSLLLPDNNRPLDTSVLLALKELFARSDAKTTALHMLSVDCQVARITGVTEEQKRLMGVSSGLELITLPHGRQLRQDLLERHHLIALGVAVDILGCTGTVGQRAAVLHKVIQLAEQLRLSARDLYAFSAVMKALELPQVVRLEMTWRALRRNHTDSAVTFEKTLKPFLKALNEGDGDVVQGPVSVPHVLPLLRVMEEEDLGEHTERGCQLLLNILQSARNAALNAQQYEAHAHSLLTGWEPIPELLEAFRTEFALRLFWGQSGAGAKQQERYEKFDKILSMLSEKLEPSGPPRTLIPEL
ncbi:breast cancer anti-estrogen resistance protein 3 homolog isoform X2 [Megalops cyprinoides]|uniref:breast cancer anti-estrogen resistance protein 3 homolog isoform X2 n=1 Tax=Megalops cyprinoides TaxID=118141 RepID=UPI0018650876|nr:breast cancer anti-estrogen resistance protein 3 homolog isoform X2 [Megalops cyprinoides]